MLNTAASYFENLANHLGVCIKIPKPNQSLRSFLGTINACVGFVLMVSGVLFGKTVLIIAGAIEVFGACILLLKKESIE